MSHVPYVIAKQRNREIEKKEPINQMSDSEKEKQKELFNYLKRKHVIINIL